MPEQQTVNFKMPLDLLSRVDEARGLIPRAAWLRQAAEEKCAREEGPYRMPGLPGDSTRGGEPPARKPRLDLEWSD